MYRRSLVIDHWLLAIGQWSLVINRHVETMLHLKVPKHDIFESGFLTQITPVWIGDLGTGPKTS
jgi:hypothetical protein